MRPPRCAATAAPCLEPIQNYNNLIGVPPYPPCGSKPAARDPPCSTGDEPARRAGAPWPDRRADRRRLLDPDRPDPRRHVRHAWPSVICGLSSILFRFTPAGAPLVVNAACPNTMAALAEFEAGPPHRALPGRKDAGGRPDERAYLSSAMFQASAPLGYPLRFERCPRRLAGLELKMFGRCTITSPTWPRASGALLHAGRVERGVVAEALGDFRNEPLRGEIIATGR